MEMHNTWKKLLQNTNRRDRSNIKVIVGMSGGVDSSVTAHLVKKAGFNVKGVFMQCWGSEDPDCKAHKDRADAVKVASYLDIPFEVWDFEKEYKQRVIEYFFAEYKAGRTPNPDILCNSEIKFGLFLDEALKKGADYVATGHYAKILEIRNSKLEVRNKKSKFVQNESTQSIEGSHISSNNITENISYSIEGSCRLPIDSRNFFIGSGDDVWKDQSYFLSRIDSSSLNKILWPLGSLLKSSRGGQEDLNNRVRKVAHNIKLPVADKPDSTGICFLEDVEVQEFLKSRIEPKKGDVINTQGEVIGKHNGVWFYTVGQRRGFEITKYQGDPVYVIKKDTKNNRLIVGRDEESESDEFEISNLKLVIGKRFVKELVGNKELYVRIRNLGEFNLVKKLSANSSQQLAKNKTEQISVTLSKPIRAIAPGQFAVFYWVDDSTDEKIVVGSGVIEGAEYDFNLE